MGQRPTNPIALFTYQTLSKKDYDRFMAAYLKSTADWAFKDFGKPNCDKYGAVSQEWHPTPTSITVEETPEAHRLLVQLEFQDKAAAEVRPRRVPRQGLFLKSCCPKPSPSSI